MLTATALLEVLESARELGRAREPLAGCTLLQSGLSQTPEALWRWGAGQPPQLRLGAPWGTVTMLCMLQAGKLDATAVGVLGGLTKGSPVGRGLHHLCPQPQEEAALVEAGPSPPPPLPPAPFFLDWPQENVSAGEGDARWEMAGDKQQPHLMQPGL